ncbi:MAG TPA: response regulator [Elusimicrobiota bacterium]|nr:response regulator [Elusimicrobiota bacterium]
MITILIVDDLPENLRLVRKLLSTQGFHVLEALNAEEALSIAASAMPDILLVDLRLGAGTMTGYELAARMRKLPGGTDAVVLALSGGAVLDDEVMSRAAGFDGFILKPFEFGEFADRLKGYLSKKRGSLP